MAARFGFSLLTLLIVGCGGPSEAPPTGDSSSSSPPPPTAAAVEATATLDQALSSIEDGNADQAMAAFLDIDWSAPGAISDDSPLATTEEDFATAGVAGEPELTNSITKDFENLRGLVAHVKAAAKAETDPTVARSMLEQLEACCVHLETTGERAMLIQLTAKAHLTQIREQLEQLSVE